MQKISSMRNIEIRFALTGHTHSYEGMTSIDQLKQSILNEYKIQYNDQKLITKAGYPIIGNQKLESSGVFKKSFSSKNPGSMTMREYNCIYLFNERQLSQKNNQELLDEEHLLAESKKVLKKLHETGVNLRQNVYELDPIPVLFNQEKRIKIDSYSTLVLKSLNMWNIYLGEFSTSLDNFKQIKYCLEEYISRWENQRKSITCLLRSVKEISQRKVKITDSIAVKTLDLESRLGSSNDSKQNQQLGLIRRNLQNIKAKKNSLDSSIKRSRNNIFEFRNRVKENINEQEKNIKSSDSFASKKIRDLENLFKELKQNYIEFIEGVNQWLNNGVEDKLLKFIEQKNLIQKQFFDAVQMSKISVHEIEEKFYQIFKHNKFHENAVQSSYKNYCQLVNFEQNTIDRLVEDIRKQINELSQSVAPKIETSKLSKVQSIQQRQRIQLYRRQIFNTRILAIRQGLKQFFKDQQKERRHFVADSISNNQKLKNICLQNVNVPCILINYDETTDNQILNNRKAQSYADNFEFFLPLTGIDTILKQLQKVKNCQQGMKKDELIPSKLKNMKILIQKSAEVFNQAYNYKIKQTQKKYENSAKLLNTRNSTLQKQINDLRCRNKELTNQKSELQSIIQNYKKQIEKIKERNLVLLQEKSGCNDHIEMIKELQIKLKQGKDKRTQLQFDKKQISNKLFDQLSLLEPVIVELENQKQKVDELSELIESYKQVMGNQQIKITRLQQQIQQSQSQKPRINKQNQKIGVNEMNNCFYDKQLKIQIQQKQPQNNTLIIGNESRTNEKSLIEIEDLKRQICQIQNQKEQLRLQNENMNEELMKIMMKDTEDMEVQTMGNNKLGQIDSLQGLQVVMKGPVKVGQLRLFMPFSNGVYVLTNSIEQDNGQTNYITSNQLNIQPIPYILDLNCLTPKSRQLLTTCTLVLLADVSKIIPGTDKNYVEAQIKSAIGFEDDDFSVRDYAKHLI